MFHHVSVMLDETINLLNIKEDGIYVDCTLGGGGHSKEILSRLTTGHLYCFDQDQDAIDAATSKLEAVSDHFTIIKSNFKNIKEELNNRGVTKVDGVLFDLGVSSYQFDEGERGFSYNQDARLDMRMNQSQSLSAYEVVNEYSYQDLVAILYKYADEKYAKQIARNIEKKRQASPIETTFQLVDIIKSSMPASALRKQGHPAKKTFQALRIEVNDELNVFEVALKDAMDLLNVEGRVAVITFHSLEDKICKYMFNEATTLNVPKEIVVVPEYMKPDFIKVTKKPVVATKEELEDNHRSHSAKLRVVERVK